MHDTLPSRGGIQMYRLAFSSQNGPGDVAVKRQMYSHSLASLTAMVSVDRDTQRKVEAADTQKADQPCLPFLWCSHFLKTIIMETILN